MVTFGGAQPMSCAVMTYGEQVCQQLRAETQPLKAVGQKTARPEHLKARRWQQQTGVRYNLQLP